MTKQDANPRTAGMRVEARIFLGIGAFEVVAATVYWFLSYEAAGTALLALTAAMSLFIGAYLARQSRRRADPAQSHEGGGAPRGAGCAEEPAAAHEYLPDASVWPFGIGLGAFVALAGLVLGYWSLLPGLAIAGGSAMGYVRQSRRRD